MIKFIIIEDEQAAFKNLKSILDIEYQTQLDFLGTTDNVKDGIQLIKKTNPDLIFLDIQLVGGSAFDILDHFTEVINFEIIFTSGFIDYKEKAMEYFAFYFLNKPIQKDQLKKVVDRYLLKKSAFDLEKYIVFKNQLETEKKTIALPLNNGGYTIINLDDLIYCEADGSYTTYYTTNNKKYMSSNNLKKVELLLSNTYFYRIHRSVLLNLKHISQYNVNGKIRLTNNKTVAVSARKRKGFIKILKLMNYTID